ncbi:acetyltransferase [Gynuella sunshinyii YC6258]|uniref:Acetyltransferase n=1 Tax=Gynuella sunshinyii YC6258 TaxID=1445510 RepID=A0A0C5VMC4_9GAMM|nr:acetyltransferase [Gynuella sunshinyii YC6258]
MSSAVSSDLSSYKVVTLDRSISRQARSLLYHCYRHEPTFQLLLQHQSPGYKQRIRATIRELIKLHFDRNETVFGVVDEVHDHLAGIAFVSDIELKMDLSDQFMWRLKMFLTTGYECTKGFIQYLTEVQQAIPSKHHRMVNLIGVHPDYQRLGLGRMLMDSIHEYCAKDENSIGIFLDTGNRRYSDFYKSMGYKVFKTVKVGEIEEAVFHKPCEKHKNSVM